MTLKWTPPSYIEQLHGRPVLNIAWRATPCKGLLPLNDHVPRQARGRAQKGGAPYYVRRHWGESVRLRLHAVAEYCSSFCLNLSILSRAKVHNLERSVTRVICKPGAEGQNQWLCKPWYYRLGKTQDNERELMISLLCNQRISFVCNTQKHSVSLLPDLHRLTKQTFKPCILCASGRTQDEAMPEFHVMVVTMAIAGGSSHSPVLFMSCISSNNSQHCILCLRFRMFLCRGCVCCQASMKILSLCQESDVHQWKMPIAM